MARFNTTRWSLIAETSGDADSARRALEALCRDYRPPVLAFVRRRGYSQADSEDLTQEFFTRFLERRWYADATPERGRFRALVLTALRRFLIDAQAREHAQKRGGGARHVEFDDSADAVGIDSPERAFMQTWLAIILDRASSRLREEYRQAGRCAHFDQLWDCIDGRADNDELGRIAISLGTRRNTIAVQLHRMRTRLRQLIRLELMATVGSREDLETELGEMRSALGGTLDLAGTE